MRRMITPLSLCILALFSCQQELPVEPEPLEGVRPELAILDGSREGGNPGFFWDRPINPNPAWDIWEDSDLSLLPFLRVLICEWDGDECVRSVRRFLPSGGFGEETELTILDVDTHPRYAVLWDAKADNVEPGKIYRISVRLFAFELGYADVDVAEGFEVWYVDPEEFYGMNSGWAVPIEFVVVQRLPDELFKVRTLVFDPWLLALVRELDPEPAEALRVDFRNVAEALLEPFLDEDEARRALGSADALVSGGSETHPVEFAFLELVVDLSKTLLDGGT